MLNAAALAYLAALVLPSVGWGCGKPWYLKTKSADKIIGGQAVPDSVVYPWFVAFIIPSSLSMSKPPIIACGGSLITPRHVLTAAHCYDRKTSNGGMLSLYRLAYLLLDKCLDQNSFIMEPQASDVRLHERYTSTNKGNDIAVVTLKWTVPYTPICLPTMFSETNRATIIGFGSILPKTVYPCIIQEARVTIFSRAQCLYTSAAKLVYNLPKALCAGNLSGGVDSCDGDSGGPLMTTNAVGVYMIRGIVSFGRGCALPNNPGIYTDVSQYLNWIEKAIGKEFNPSSNKQPDFWNVFSQPQTNWIRWFNGLVTYLNGAWKTKNGI